MTSPYRAVLGPAFDELHPRLRAYFDAVPEGSTGRGRGVFETVGTPRRWLWPALAPFGRAHVMFPVWEHGVTFTVENVPASSARGGPAVRAVRRFELGGRTREMRDEIGADGGLIVDRLGSPAVVEAWFSARVTDGALRLVSRRVAVRAGRAWVVLPRPIAPVVALTERYDEEREAQLVSVVVRTPLIGRVYQYAGAFRYGVTQGSE
ncbi:DUF4166 domain-containing protein [Leifsonia shinshuensis]|uniref:DUF4166 domain-containing protein n=1 Tax=Leifsonia shinshuensis TaxID=150026 RepID=UPI001F50508F|nr:DUF4166 domain-containing protein [Leifsonia shinshuensis]MCI0155627.1 DUF4166 domain-containing protein [Leifsonia shinshuensis]